LKANTVMARLINRNFENAVANFGDIVNVPKRGALSVNDKAANTQITLQTPSASTAQVTLNKYKEVSFLVEDVAAAQANQSIIDGYISDGMKALAEQIDSDILALYSGFSTTPIDARTGSGGIVVASITEARRLLNSAKVPLSDRHIVWHEDAEKELLALGQFTNAQYDPANATALQEASLGRKYGFSHYMDQQVKVATAECKNMAFHRDAMTLAARPLPAPPANTGVNSAVMNEDGFAVRILWQYDIMHKGMVVSLDCLYGVAELRDEFAVVIRSSEV
jgi:hypothetical protein